MIPLQGAMLPGLDEFMLRLGHLVVLCDVASDVGTSWSRIGRGMAKVLTRPVPVPMPLVESVTDYLKRKRLCRIVNHPAPGQESRVEGRLRYPDLTIRVHDNRRLSLETKVEGKSPIEIWWQDRCLASPSVRSRVGAITVGAKAGSKTGVSHICDWARLIGLLSKAGEVSSVGRLIIGLRHRGGCDINSINPYILGNERLALAHHVVSADIDFFSRFVPKLSLAKSPLRKADGAELFAQTVMELCQEAREARYLTAGRKNVLLENLRDLEMAAKAGHKPLGGTSTAWHRASSRFETYVDLGLLEKGRNGDSETYEYVYYPTDALEIAARSLVSAVDARCWIENHLASAVFSCECSHTCLTEDELSLLLPDIASSLARPAGPLPIDALAVGLAWVKADRGQPTSIADCRHGLEQLAHSRPTIARLSRGGFGDRAEFITLDLRRLEGLKT